MKLVTYDDGKVGRVEGEEIPYKPEALATKKQNFANRLTLDPEVKAVFERALGELRRGHEPEIVEQPPPRPQ